MMPLRIARRSIGGFVHTTFTAALLGAAVLASSLPANAQNSDGAALPEQPGAPALQNQAVPAPPGAAEPAAQPAGLLERKRLLGTLGGVRTALDRYGVDLGITETSEVLGNVTGGVRRGAAYEGLTQVSLSVDLGKAVGLAGGTFTVSGLQIHGRGLTDNLSNLNVASGIEANRSTRLYELWFQQELFGGKADVKIGQQAADAEFITSEYSGLFVNESFGWPTLPAVDLPSGGPAYPLAALGVRLRAKPVPNVAVLLGVFNGDPAGRGEGNPLERNRSGTNFDLNGGTFVIGEVQYALNSGEGATGLPGTYKLGAWYHSRAQDNQLFSDAGLLSGTGTADPITGRRNNYSIYAVVDQLIYRPPGVKDGGLGVFARAMGAPGDRNQVNVFVSGGVSYKGLFGREDDTVGLGVSWARISDTFRASDAALARSTAAFSPIRSSEVVLELTYQAKIAPWLILQPDFQYVFNPGGGISNPSRPDRRIGDAAIFGLRTSITF